MDKKYIEAVSKLSSELSTVLLKVSDCLQPYIREVCIRVNKPVSLQTLNSVLFLNRDGSTSKLPTQNSMITLSHDVAQCMKSITEYSLHSYRDNINSGFITVKGGHRAGVVGSCSYNQDKLVAVCDISSINLRIARQIKGVANSLIASLFRDRLYSTLIVGNPCSGKTTLLRDIAYCLSNGENGIFYKVSMIDERGELAAVQSGIPQNDVGVLTDVLDGYKKGEGMRIAVRSMSPNVIILDEIGGIDDANAIRESLNAGAAVIATVHASSKNELYKKKHIKSLIQNGFERIVMLREMKIEEIIEI